MKRALLFSQTTSLQDTAMESSLPQKTQGATNDTYPPPPQEMVADAPPPQAYPLQEGGAYPEPYPEFIQQPPPAYQQTAYPQGIFKVWSPQSCICHSNPRFIHSLYTLIVDMPKKVWFLPHTQHSNCVNSILHKLCEHDTLWCSCSDNHVCEGCTEFVRC